MYVCINGYLRAVQIELNSNGANKENIEREKNA